jgi:hypothetical protein
VTPSFNRLVEAVTNDELSKLNTLDLEDSLSLNKSFKPRKVMPIPSHVAATKTLQAFGSWSDFLRLRSGDN